MPSPPEDRAQPEPGDLTSMHIQHAIRNERASVAWLVSRLTPLLLCQAQHRIAPSLRRICDPTTSSPRSGSIVLGSLPELTPADGSHSRGLLRFASTVLIRRIRDLVEKHVVNKPPSVSLPEDAGEGPGALLAAETRGVVSARRRRRAARARVGGRFSRASRDRIATSWSSGASRALAQGRRREGRLTPENVGVRYHRILKKLREALPDFRAR